MVTYSPVSFDALLLYPTCIFDPKSNRRPAEMELLATGFLKIDVLHQSIEG
jgi:hypothetical protein